MIFYDFGHPKIYGGFTTRDMGNMSFSRDPNRDAVLAHYRHAAEMLDVPFSGMTGVKQVHGGAVLTVTKANVGLGLDRAYDAMITQKTGITLCTVHADCTPALLFDPAHMAVAAIHSGWRSTALKITQATVEAMQAQYGTRPETLQAVIGPAISLDAFEVDEDVYHAFRAAFGTLLERPDLCQKRGVKWHLSVPGFVRETLLNLGVPDNHIQWDRACTARDEARFFSHRRDHGTTGAMSAMIGIRP